MNVLLFSFLFIFCKSSEAQVNKIYDQGILTNSISAKVSFESVTIAGDPVLPDISGIPFSTGTKNHTSGLSGFRAAEDCTPPTITLGANPSVCTDATSADLTYSATTDDPDQYSIDFDAAAEAQGFTDIVNATLPASPIVITISGAAPDTYNGVLTVYNSTSGCVSAAYPITVTVNPNVNAGTVSGNSSLCIGTTDGYSSNGDGGGSWSSTNTGVATVDASTGLVTAVNPGTTDITYTISSGCGSPLSSYVTLTVNSNANAGTVSGTSSLCIGTTDTYSSNGDGGGSWNSTDTNVATVDPSTGLVTAVNAGTTDITYTVGCNAGAYMTLTVNPNANAGTVSGVSSLCIGTTDYYNSNGDGSGTWSSTNTGVATVNPSTGQVTAVSAGTTDITYTVGCNTSAFLTLTVNSGANAGTVSGNSTLCAGATDTYSSNGDGGGSWNSNNTGVATVDPSTGLVTAVSAGTTDIIYTVTSCGSQDTAVMILTVNANLNPGTVSGNSTLCTGATDSYSSNGDGGGSWSSTNTSVATVDPSTGQVTAVSAGTTDITYTIGCNASASLTLTVNSDANAGTVSGNSSLCTGTTDTYSSNGDGGGSWNSTNTYVATVDASTGQVTTVNAGTTDITYTINSGCGSPVSSFMTLTVNSSANAGTISGNSTLCTGATDSYSSNGDGGGSWNSTNTGVATVDPSTGQVTAVNPGTTDITYTVGCASASMTLTVNPNLNPGSVSGNSILCIGATDTYSTNGDGGGTWSSTNTGVATVDPSTGQVTAVSAGTTDISYTVGCNAGAFMTLTVNPDANAGTVSGNSTLCIGATDSYSSNGDGGGSWSSTDTNVATVDASTGLVTALNAGSTDIAYTISSGCALPVPSYMTLTVNSNANAGTVSGVSSLCTGATDTYSSNGDGGGSWSSTDPGVATVDASTGLVTAVNAGTTDITYTVGCNASAFMTLTVNAISGALAANGSCKNMNPGAGATYFDGSCNTITRLVPNGGNPLNGMVNSCVTIDGTVQTYNGHAYVQRHYDIEPGTSPGTATARITLYALQNEFDTFNANNGTELDLPTGPADAAGIANLLVTQWLGTGTAPGNYTGAAVLINPADADIVWDAINNWWAISFDVTGFTGFYIHTDFGLLPVNMLNFGGYKDGNRNQLRWTTANENNNRGFDIQRSADGVNYSSLGFVNSQVLGGNSTIQLNYTFTDNSVIGSKQYYRLRQVDFDGHNKFSNIVLIKSDKPVTLMIDGLFPNPASTLVNVLITAPNKDKVTLVVTDIAGGTVKQQMVNVETGINTIPVNIAALSAGTYMVKLICSNNCESAAGKFVKQ